MPKYKERMRVSRACDLCKKKKIRCSGTHPCELCLKGSLTCTFDAPYSRGKRRTTDSVASGISIDTIPVDSVVLPASTSASAPTSMDGSLMETRSDDLPNVHVDIDAASLASGPPNISSRASPELGASDRQGHFLNDSSGLSFLLRLHRRLKGDGDKASPTSLFTLGEPALPTFNEAEFTLPPRHEADLLVRTYFELSSAGYRFLHRPTVEDWVNQIYENGQISGAYAHSKLAVILGLFAQATRYPDSHAASKSDLGLTYFQAAEQELARETESANLYSAQALLECCFYVLTRSRLNHCWSLFGTTSRLILALGFHRRSRNNGRSLGAQGIQTNYLDCESRRRLFWCAYNLDKTLSTILGRPRALHDSDIDQDLPNIVDDKDLTPTSMVIAKKDNMNVMLGTVHNQKLGRILSKILATLYGLPPPDRLQRYSIMKELASAVNTWRQQLPHFLNAEKVDSSLLKPLFQRQSNILSLAAGHVEILIYRPCLFSDYKRHHYYSADSTDETFSKVQLCLRAAMEIVRVIECMAEAEQLYAASWVAHYQAFCAAVVLYTFTLKSTYEDPSVWGEYFRAAERCQNLLASIKNEHSLARRFMLIMEEYRAEVMQKLQQDSPAARDFAQDPSALPESNGAVSWNRNLPQDPSLLYPDIPNWEQLDYLALDLGDMIPDMDFTYTDRNYLGE